jgi:hypothetical protein
MSGSNVYLAADETTATVRSLYTIIAALDAAAATTPTAATLHGPLCSYFVIQNKHASESLFYQTDSTAASGANIAIAGTDFLQFPPKVDKYDLREQFVRVNSNSNDFTVAIHWD